MSLRLRLAIWYGSLTTFVVALVCGYSYAVHSRTHYDELDHVLQAIAAHEGAELATAPLARDDILNASLLLGTGIRLLDREGHVQTQSENAVSLPSVDLRLLLASPEVRPYAAIGALAPTLHVAGAVRGRFNLLTDSRGNRFRVYVESLRDSTGYLVATLPLAPLDSAVHGFARLMLVLALAGALVALGVGWIVARQVLRPVTGLTNAAETIAASRQFSQRVVDGHGHDELALLARTINSMLGSLQDAYESQVRFVAAASHELRAPLTVIQANLDLLQAAKGSDTDRNTAVAEASAEAQRMTRLVADLLVLARADAGVPIRSEPLELDRLLVDVIRETRHLRCGSPVEVSKIDPCTVLGDHDRLQQLFLNVIENAVKYTPPTGSIRVAITRNDYSAAVAITDTGSGIGAADLPHVFERFFRADPARSRDPGGSGLGLGIAQWIAAEHGGTIDIASELGIGTTVVIVLPITTQSASADHATFSPSPARSSRFPLRSAMR